MRQDKFAQRLYQLRKEKALTKAKLGELTNMNPSQLSKYELNKNEPTASVIIKLCKFFNVSAGYILGLED